MRLHNKSLIVLWHYKFNKSMHPLDSFHYAFSIFKLLPHQGIKEDIFTRRQKYLLLLIQTQGPEMTF